MAPALAGGVEPLRHLSDRNDVAARFVTALLWAGLIFELDRAGAGRFQFADRAVYVEKAAVADVGVGDQRGGRYGADRAHAVGHFRQSDEADIGHPDHRRGLSVAGEIERFETRLLGDQRRKSVVDAGRSDDLAAREQRLERSRGG